MSQPERKIKEPIEVDEAPNEEGSDLPIVLRLTSAATQALADPAAREEFERLGAIEEAKMEAGTAPNAQDLNPKPQRSAA